MIDLTKRASGMKFSGRFRLTEAMFFTTIIAAITNVLTGICLMNSGLTDRGVEFASRGVVLVGVAYLVKGIYVVVKLILEHFNAVKTYKVLKMITDIWIWIAYVISVWSIITCVGIALQPDTFVLGVIGILSTICTIRVYHWCYVKPGTDMPDYFYKFSIKDFGKFFK